MHLCTSELEAAIDRISQKISGFYIGRYDVRYESSEDLGHGRGFQILELNGVAGEPTSAYDASKKITEAFALLFRHWELAFAIGAVIECEVRLIDERLTTVSATANLRLAGKTAKNSRSIIDQEAAAIILEQALAGEKATGNQPGRPLTEFTKPESNPDV
jgi:hypothetical protein